MKHSKRSLFTVPALLLGVLFYMTACDLNPVESDSDTDTYNLYEGLEKLNESPRVTISQGQAVGRDAWFEFKVENIDSRILAPGVHDGWCIEWTKPIAQQGDVHEVLQMYSTYGQDRWKPLNYFLNIKDDLKAEDPSLNYREFQAVIWTVSVGPAFDLDRLSTDELPPRLLSDGQPNFDIDKVKAIAAKIKADAGSFNSSGKKYAVIMQTGDEEQDIIVPVDPNTVSHGYVEGVTPSDEPQFAERSYPVIQADWDGPGGDSRWLGWNLGATDAPESIDDDRPESAGWYFQYNRLQGYYHDGTDIIPDTPWDSSTEDSPVWMIENDPCSELLGSSWRIPTREEWEAFFASAPLVTVTVPPRYELPPEHFHEDSDPQEDEEIEIPDRNHPFESVLNLHRGNYLSTGIPVGGSPRGSYWSSEEHSSNLTWAFLFSERSYLVPIAWKNLGKTLRCIED